MRSIYINKEGIVCYIPDCPEEPKCSDYVRHNKYYWQVNKFEAVKIRFQKALTAAKQSAVPFEKSTRDQYLTKLSLLNAKSINPITDQDVFRLFDKHFQKDTIHPFPEDQYDVEVKRIKVGTEVVDGFTGNYMMIYKDVAVLIPVKSEQKDIDVTQLKEEPESQDEIWSEAQDFVKNNLGTYSNDLVCDMARWAIEALKKHYTITRKYEKRV